MIHKWMPQSAPFFIMTNMIRKRIGKDLTFRLQVLTNGRPDDLDGRNLKLEVISKYAKLNLPYKVDGHILTFAFPAASQKHTCRYRISVWENFGEDGQTVVDICDAFELVPTTCQECGDTPGLDVETVELGAVDLEAGIAGQSAYDIWLSLGNEGTEADFIAFLRQPAVDAASKADESSRKADSAALAAQTAKDEMSELYQQVLDSESVRVMSENERIGAERDRVSAEEHRQTAELEREQVTSAAVLACETAAGKATEAGARADQSASKAEQAAAGIDEKISGKQDKSDNTLKTIDKTVAGAINEIYDNMIIATEFTESDIDELWQD